ncbi:hypothetical protein KKD40_07690, partial [Candidatus Micrarchaeota archaeon]|nr:hypothetical protein [Candidatus Micrarchaeota archaeon]
MTGRSGAQQDVNANMQASTPRFNVTDAVTGEMVAQVQHQASEVIAHSLDLMQRRGIEIPTDLRGFATDPNQARDLATFATENNWNAFYEQLRHCTSNETARELYEQIRNQYLAMRNTETAVKYEPYHGTAEGNGLLQFGIDTGRELQQVHGHSDAIRSFIRNAGEDLNETQRADMLRAAAQYGAPASDIFSIAHEWNLSQSSGREIQNNILQLLEMLLAALRIAIEAYRRLQDDENESRL